MSPKHGDPIYEERCHTGPEWQALTERLAPAIRTLTADDQPGFYAVLTLLRTRQRNAKVEQITANELDGVLGMLGYCRDKHDRIRPKRKENP